MDNSNKPSLRAYVGATGSGKGVSIREHLKKEKAARIIVWDPLGEYADFVKKTTSSLAEVAKSAKGESFAVAYYPGPNAETYKSKFAMFCRIAFAAGNLVMMVEELADVTSPSYAPPAWRQCTKKGRHAGLRIVAATQRPADLDKHFLGGCTYIRCFTLRFPADRKAMAGAMDVPIAQIAGLMTTEADGVTTINYVERDFREGKTTIGSKKIGGR